MALFMGRPNDGITVKVLQDNRSGRGYEYLRQESVSGVKVNIFLSGN